MIPPAKLQKRTTDLDDAVSVHASFAKFAGDILSSVVCYMFSVPQLDAASVICNIFLRRGAFARKVMAIPV